MHYILSSDHPWEGAVLRGRPIVRYRDILRRAAQKRLKRSGSRLGFGLGLAQGTWKYILGGVHTGATWRIPLNRPCVAAMGLVMKLL